MNSRDDKVYLEDISKSINIIFRHVENMTEFEFSKNILVQDFKTANPHIEWLLMKDMRNKLSHEYFGVSMSTIYATVKEDLPVLLEHIKKLI